jgi:DNA polymerase I-like protein with 3'-5' exonuclease and polymerase domains
MSSLWHLFQPSEPTLSTWTPDTPPSLSGVDEVYLDCETDGLRWWEDSRPIGIAVKRPGEERGKYLPFGHRGGGNLGESIVKEWAHRELRGKKIRNLKMKFDVHEMRAWGVDLIEQGCTFTDISHTAALLDDNRRQFNLDILLRDFLGQEKVGKELDAAHMANYHASQVAPRAAGDVEAVERLTTHLYPMLAEQGLMDVQRLEDRVIPAVCEMERNGALIDVGLLDRMIAESDRVLTTCLMNVYRESGMRINPDSSKDMIKLFHQRGLKFEEFTDTGKPSFTDAVLRGIHDPAITWVRRAGKLASIRSKFLLKYRKDVDRHGILRYSLNQLQSDEGGTVSGRFSSSAINGYGINIQQQMSVEGNLEALEDILDMMAPDNWPIIRRLHIPLVGADFFSADAKQIEYRMFAHYANNLRVIRAYEENPDLSFHEFIWGILKGFKESIGYKATKNLNFAKIYGAGVLKLALMLGYIIEREFLELKMHFERFGYDKMDQHPKLRETLEINRIYARALPEVAPLLKEAGRLAETRGYVRTILGRRSRFPNKSRLHKALNAVIQGGAADIAKLKIASLFESRKELELMLRHTEHDEICGDLFNPSKAAVIRELLNEQSIPMRVPIRWDVETGKNWALGEVEKYLKKSGPLKRGRE